MLKLTKSIRRFFLFLAAIVFAILLNVPGYANPDIATSVPEKDPCGFNQNVGTEPSDEDLTDFSNENVGTAIPDNPDLNEDGKAYDPADDLTDFSETQLFCLFEEELEGVELAEGTPDEQEVDAIIYGLADWGDASDGDDDDDVITEANLSEVLPPSEVRSIAEAVAETTAQFRSGTIALEQKGQQIAQTIAEKSATIEKQLRSPVDLIWQKLQLIAADNSPTAGYSKAFAKAVSNKKK